LVGAMETVGWFYGLPGFISEKPLLGLVGCLVLLVKR
jgi:hypothetical protein